MSIHLNNKAAVSADDNLSYRATVIGLAIIYGKSTHPCRVPECVMHSLWQSVADGCPVSPMVLDWLYRRQAATGDTQFCISAENRVVGAESGSFVVLYQCKPLITLDVRHRPTIEKGVSLASVELLLGADGSAYPRGLRYE